MISDYIFAEYKYEPIDEDAGETAESIFDKLIKWTDSEIENYYGIPLPFHKKFTSRANLIGHFISVNRVIE